jgi:excisionase family DNA binding protein
MRTVERGARVTVKGRGGPGNGKSCQPRADRTLADSAARSRSKATAGSGSTNRPHVVERLLTIDEVATRLNVGTRFVRRLVAERRIAFHKVGRHVRFDPADVDALIEAGRVERARGMSWAP